MRIAMALLLLCPGACGPAAEPAANNAAAPASAADPRNRGADQELAEWREDMLRGCIGGGRDRAGPNVPVEQHCGCAVERVVADRTVAQLRNDELTGEHEARFRTALRACIAEISPDYPLRPDN